MALIMNSDLVSKAVNASGYRRLKMRPGIYYGAIIKHEYDNRRITINGETKIRHKTREIYTSDIKEKYIKAVPIEQPLIIHKLFKEFKRLKPSCDDFYNTYKMLLNKYNLSCNNGLNHVNHGMLVVDGEHLNSVTDNPSRNILKLDLEAKNWFESFASLHIFIMY